MDMKNVVLNGTGTEAKVDGVIEGGKLVQQQVKVVLQHMDGLLDILNLIIMNIL